MRLNFAQIFPISDEPSARLMKLKASCLFRAGLLSVQERASVARKAREVLARGAAPAPRQPHREPQAA